MALQPLAGQKAAVVTVLIRLPSGDEEYALPEQCGIAIGSAIITVGTSAYFTGLFLDIFTLIIDTIASILSNVVTLWHL